MKKSKFELTIIEKDEKTSINVAWLFDDERYISMFNSEPTYDQEVKDLIYDMHQMILNRFKVIDG